jgi:DNA-binding IclR family transcriptional regulator
MITKKYITAAREAVSTYPIAAMNISTSSMRNSKQEIEEIFLPALKEVAEKLNGIMR